MSATKIGGSTTNILNCYFSKKKFLHFGASEQMSTYGKLNLLTIKSTYLVFSSRERQKRPIQIKVYYKLFYSVWKETSHKPLKVTTAKNNFPSMYIIDKACFNLCFLFHVITGRHYFLRKFGSNQRFGATLCCCVPWHKCFETGLHFMSAISKVTLQCFPSMLLILKVHFLNFIKKKKFFW